MDEFYDLSTDQEELYNRIDDPSMQAIILNLKERLLKFYLETGDVVPHRTDKDRKSFYVILMNIHRKLFYFLFGFCLPS